MESAREPVRPQPPSCRGQQRRDLSVGRPLPVATATSFQIVRPVLTSSNRRVPIRR
jgi:hypothetical protein